MVYFYYLGWFKWLSNLIHFTQKRTWTRRPLGKMQTPVTVVDPFEWLLKLTILTMPINVVFSKSNHFVFDQLSIHPARLPWFCFKLSWTDLGIKHTQTHALTDNILDKTIRSQWSLKNNNVWTTGSFKLIAYCTVFEAAVFSKGHTLFTLVYVHLHHWRLIGDCVGLGCGGWVQRTLQRFLHSGVLPLPEGQPI